MNNTPTPRTDFAIKASNGQWSYVLKLCAEELERELTAVTEKLKETQKHLKDANRGAEINAHALRINADKLAAVTEQRDKYHDYWESFGEERIKLKTELATVTKERDRLAEAFQDMLNDTLTPTNDEWIVTDNENYIEIASIKTCDSIASVHGGKTIGDQYDLAGRIAKVPQLERELATVTEQLKAAQDGWHDEITKGLTELRRAESIYTKAQERAEKAEEQRDRLAEVIEAASVLIAAKGRHNTMLAYNGLREALQSLNQPTP